MSAGKALSPISLAALAIAEGATTPVPAAPQGAGALVWSSTTAAVMRWDGAQWRSLRPVLSAAATSQAIASGVNTDVPALTLPIAANLAAVGTTLSVEMIGSMDSTAAANTANFWIKAGATKIATTAVPIPAVAASGKLWWMRFLLTFRTIGASGTLEPSGYGFVTGATTPNAGIYVTTPAVVNTTTALSIVAGFNWTTAVASQIIRCDLAVIDQLN